MSNEINMTASTGDIRLVAIAILQYQDKFLMQLRDDIPTIVHPGVWTMFGGHLETDENPETGICRELHEEIGYRPKKITLFRTYITNQVIHYVFYGQLDVGLELLELNEGCDMALLSPEQITQGTHYSLVVSESRPLAFRHRQIMLDFFSTL